MNQRVMLLRSDVDDAHSHVVRIPDDWNETDAVRRAAELIARVQESNPDFSWDDDLVPALEAAGLTPLSHVLGPTWDSPI